MPIVSDTPLARRVSGKPRVHVTRHLVPVVEARMAELFDVVTNTADAPLSRDELVAAMRDADVLVPTVTDKIDATMLEEAGDRLGLIA
ncbi:MAG: D-glycerate dehydrogenase, partial [Novosphingobium sp.]